MKYTPQATFEQIVAYRPDDPSTHTVSLLVNAVAAELFTTTVIDCKTLARSMQVDERKLASAILLETGMPLRDIINKYRVLQFQNFRTSHPDQDFTPDQIAQALGYSSAKSISRLLNTHLRLTPTGRPCNAGPDTYLQRRKEIREGRF